MNTTIETRFSGCLELEQIRQRVTVRPEPVGDLSGVDPVLAGTSLAETLKQIYLPNQFSLSFIQEMVGRADVFSRSLFASERDYHAKIYDPPEVEVAPLCLTGLAGVGKSQTISALRRALPAPIEFESSHFKEKVTLVSHWYASARDKAGGRQMLADFVLGSEPTSKGPNTNKLLNLCRRIVNRDGISLLILEETQHATPGKGVTLVTNILLTMAVIGPPMVYVANYSLLHKLLDRNSEDKQRLLSEPRIMLPDDPDGQDWKAYIAECVRVSSGQIRAQQGELAAELYRSTFGLKRLAVQLLKLAYIECRKAGRRHLGLGDISQAYRSSEYWSNRVDVEELHRIAVEGLGRRARKDLWCPLEIPAARKSNILQFARQERDERVIAQAIDSSMTAQEREAVKQLEPASRSPEAKAPRRKPIPKATPEETQMAFAKYVEQTNSDKPKKPR
ncbi:transposase [Pseudomonas guariconensis]|uniref:transposase n=1 Tax=Pseudomonas guariconensis TaxID=1288410 RepID=UPI0018D92CE6|nr:transposase [Pseudomonas guariconensis]MBH3356707.1 transposase [Pseudomonas guariconensis]